MLGKIVKIVLLFAIIAASASFILFRYYGNQDQANWFNINFREKITVYPVLRSIYGLHWDGDAKSDYLSDKKYKKLLVEIESIEQCRSYFNPDELSKKINEIVMKPEGVQVILSDTIDEDERIFLESNALDRAIEHLKGRLTHYQMQSDTAYLQVFCLDNNRENPTEIGLTYRENTILLFYNRIRDITENNPASRLIYIVSTLLHEFGHQLGLDHDADPSCLMAESVDSPGNAAGALKAIPQNFCQASLDHLAEMKAKYNE